MKPKIQVVGPSFGGGVCAGAILLLAAGVSSAQSVQTLYATPTSLSWRDNYNGASGCQFTVGPANVVVSHLGYFSTNTVRGLATNHYVGIYSDSSPIQLLAEVTVPAGLSADAYTNSFYWMPLDPPVLLSSNTTYYVAAMPDGSDGDWWGDSFTATFNGFFVGATTNSLSAPATAYGPGGVWPVPSFSTFGSNTTYCIEGLANLPIDKARVGVQITNLNVAVGQTLSVLGYASGRPPITFQWWLAGSPATPVANQTNATLLIPNAAAGNSGIYFLTASNALGGETSANVTILVSDYPVGFQQQPANTSVFNNYPVALSLIATGTPPISLQWSRNGVAIPGAATNDAFSLYLSNSYSFFASYPSNNGDIYTAMVSNNLLSTPYTATSSNAVLTVLPNLAYPQEFLHGAPPTNVFNSHNGTGNPQSGGVGGIITIGNTPVVVTHLGYCVIGLNEPTLQTNHHVSLYSWNGSTAGLLGYVVVTNGTPTNSAVNGYLWVELNPPLVLTNNIQYLLAAETFASGGLAVDPWGDTYGVPDWNAYFTPSGNANSAVWGTGSWPTAPTSGEYGSQMYSAPNMAILALTNLSTFVTPTNVTQAAGTSATLTGIVAGEAPMIVQWYYNGAPLPGQTNLTLFLANLQNTNAGSYYLVATNYQSSAVVTSGVSTVTVNLNPPLVALNPAAILVTNFQGWGSSLGWWANVVGNYSNRNDYCNLAFTQLKLNIVRYNIAGGENPALTNTITNYRAIMQGFEPTNGVWNWNADQNQRWVLRQALALGANWVDAYANSPPWWMTVSGSVTGAVDGTNNLNVAYENTFAIYLATVVSNLTVLDGAHFNYVTPMNEPGNTDIYGSGAGEACHMSIDQQSRVVADLNAQLNALAPSTGVDAPEDWGEQNSINDLDGYTSGSRADVALVSTHTYGNYNPTGLRNLALSLGRPCWVCEYGDNDGSGLTMAQRIHDDLTGLQAQAWIYWQVVDNASGWGFLYNPLTTNSTGGFTTNYALNEKFYVMGQFSEFIQPGSEVINAGDTTTLAAYNTNHSTLVLVAVNTNAASFYASYNLSAFAVVPPQASVYQTVPGANQNLAALSPLPVTNQQFVSYIPGQSVTTFVLTNISRFAAIAMTNTAPTNIVFAVSGQQLTLSWPADHTGWQLQGQTNNLAVGISTNWVDVSSSSTTNQVIIPINLTNGSVFYRLIYPP